MKYISVDGEFSGLDHTKYELISLGMCNCYDFSDQFYIEIKPEKPMDPEATKIHQLSEDHLKKNGKERIAAAKEIHEWLTRDNEDMLIFVGYPVILDWIFLDQLFKEANLSNPFHYEPIEIHTLGISILNLKPGFAETELRSKLRLQTVKNKHNALADAIAQAEEYIGLTNLANHRRGS